MPFSARKRETACLHSHYYRISLQVNKLKIPEIFKIHFMKRLPAVLVTVFSVAAFGLYYIGVYDISFIERPESWKGNLDAFIAVLDKSYKGSPPPEETEPEENGTDGTGENSSKPGGSDTNNARPGGESHAEILTFESVSALKDKGYSLTDKIYDSTCVFGILETSYALPDKLTGTLKTFDRENFITYDDGRETEREIVKDQKNRYALEMYMGYIIYDDNGTLYLIGPDGSVLTAFDDTQYIPAYTRDLQGRPLFYRNNSYSIKYPTSKSDPDENGDSEWYDTANLKVDDRIYYYLSPNGQSFIKSDYNDVTDNRGLYFDYPSYYGNPDSSLKRYYLNTTKVLTDLEGKTSLLYCPLWCFSRTKLDFGLLKFDKEGNNLAEEGGKSLSEMFPYTKAYSYSENYASVMTDIKWDYYHEEENADGTKENKYYEVTSSEMRVVDSTGKTLTGTMANNGAVTKTLDTTTTSYTIAKGYHSGSGKVSITKESKSVTPTKSAQTVTPTSGKVLSSVSVAAIPALYVDTTESTTDAASAANILSGKKAWVNGSQVTGTMANNGATSLTIDGLTTLSVAVPAGYTSGGTVSLTDDIYDALAAI